jgi:hypothetical protein
VTEVIVCRLKGLEKPHSCTYCISKEDLVKTLGSLNELDKRAVDFLYYRKSSLRRDGIL